MSPGPLKQATVVVTVVLAALPVLSSGGSAVAATGCSQSPGPVRSAPGAGKTVALTFDDGPTKFTAQVLRILRRSSVRATFFVTGRRAAAQSRLLGQVASEGHLIAGHTYDHRYPQETADGWTRGYIAGQLTRTNRVLTRASGKPVCFFRPPGGYQSSGMYDAVRARRTAVVMWSIDTEDWKQPGKTTSAATRRIVGRATAGGAQTHPLVLFHDGKASHEPDSQVSPNRSNTVAALPAVIAYYRVQGYRFVDLAGATGLSAEGTQVHVSATPKRVPAGAASTLTGSVTATTGPVADRPVRWSWRHSGTDTWKRGGSVTSSAQGGFRVTVRPEQDTEYRFELPGSSRYRTASESVAVSAYAIATAVTVTGPASITAGETAVVDIAVTSNGEPRPGVTVAMTRTVEGTTVVTRMTTDRTGHAAFSDQPATTTRYTFVVAKALPYEPGSAVHDVAVVDQPPPQRSPGPDS
jgi:peptidoglycan/xylan/chitin deacetylase (PgdA/CDA1 family)